MVLKFIKNVLSLKYELLTMNKHQKKAFASVRTKYYKADKAYNILDHSNANRNGFTCSANVNPKFSHDNVSLYAKGCKNGAEALNNCLLYTSDAADE